MTDGSLHVDHILPDSPDNGRGAGRVRAEWCRTPGLSVEFHSLDEARVSGVREIRQSLISAVAVVPAGAYNQATAEVRGRSDTIGGC